MLKNWDFEKKKNMEPEIEKKIQELYELTPDYVGVGFGTKYVHGIDTQKKCFFFTVPWKRPLEDLDIQDLLPSEVEVDGIIYPTDVVETRGPVRFLACGSTTASNCYGWNTTPPTQQQRIRPVRGGIQMTTFNNRSSVGTLGFLALDVETQSIVGVTNNHVAIANAFFASVRTQPITEFQNETTDIAFQNLWSSNPATANANDIGDVIRYVPMVKSGFNQVDGALISINQGDFDPSISWQQFGLTGVTTPLPFASTSEINSLVGNTDVISSGRTTGAKQGVCSLTITSVSSAVPVGTYEDQNGGFVVNFNNLISFTRNDSQCAWPIAPGDSGSCLIAFVGGEYKIVGLNFAGSNAIGFANRIDQVASQLSIQAWSGGTPNFVITKYLCTDPGLSPDKILNFASLPYWQVGIQQPEVNCGPGVP